MNQNDLSKKELLAERKERKKHKFYSVIFYLVFFLTGYPYKWKPYPRKNPQARKR